MDLKRISPESIGRALDLAERYRLLNEPEQAASICHDVLAIEPGNVEAIRNLFLATTEQFGKKRGTRLEDAEKVAGQFPSEYEQAYYGGIAAERWARTKLQEAAPPQHVGDWLHKAMEKYEQAENLRAAGNDDAMLRWNACARLISRVPELERPDKDDDPGLWD